MSEFVKGVRVWLVVLFLVAGTAPAHGSWRVTVRGAKTDAGPIPIISEIPSAIPAGLYALGREGRKTAIPAAVFLDGGNSYLGAILDRIDEGSTTYTMTSSRDDETPPMFRRRGPDIDIRIVGKDFTTYRGGSAPKPFLYPILGPTGAPFTRAYPMANVEGEDRDHPHQRSFWFTHGEVSGVDFWTEEAGHGSIKPTSTTLVGGDRVVALIRTTDDWIGPDGEKVCEDERVWRFFESPSPRIIDFEITIKAGAGPVTFGDTKEGTFGIRVASSMDVDKKRGGKITNAEGLTDAEAWGKPSPWVDYTGPVQGRTVGLAILNHPESFRHPTTWHVRTYGLFAANPFGWKDFGRAESGSYTIPAGGSIRHRYRVILHEGDTASARIADAYETYASPPKIEVQVEGTKD